MTVATPSLIKLPEFSFEETLDQRRVRDRLGLIIDGDRRLMEAWAWTAQSARGHSRPVPVIFRGPSGSGKDLFARGLHDLANIDERGKSTYLAVNAAVTDPALLASNLFGHEIGSYTGAVKRRPGYFESVGSGTVFLDEIGRSTLDFQVALLRAIENKKVIPVGGDHEKDIHARLVFATNQDLEAMVEEGKFLSDLYHRIPNHIPIPSWNMQEILNRRLIVTHIVADLGHREQIPVHMDDADIDYLARHTFSGSVREVRAVLERAFSLSPRNGDSKVRLTRTALETAMSRSPGKLFGTPAQEPMIDVSEGTLAEMTGDFQRVAIVNAIKACGGNLSLTAERLGMCRSNLYRKMRSLKMDIDPQS